MCGHYRPGRPTLELARELGLDGVFFRLPFSLSESLDPAELRDGAARAAELGLYLELGCGRINPHNWDKTPQVAAAGDGDYRRGFRRVVEACVALGHRDLHVVTGTYSDRFRTDLSWPEQIAAMRTFLREVEPMLRDLGVRLNPETHEEITTVELLRLIDEFGPERLGLTFDTGNVLVQGEDPIAVARRIAPYVRQTHLKDAILFFDEHGLVRQPRPVGQGLIDWPTLIGLLARCNPGLNCTLEPHKGFYGIQIFDPAWLDLHPDLSARELCALVGHASRAQARMAAGEIPEAAAYGAIPFAEQRDEFYRGGAAHLRAVFAGLGL